MRVTVVHNPEAGTGAPARAELLAALRSAGHDPHYIATRAGDELVVQEPGAAVLVAGGDGTLRQTAFALRGRDVPIVLLPTGTANNMAGTLGLDRDLDACVRRVSAGRRLAIDIGTSRGAWGDRAFIEGAGFGVVPELIDIIERYAHGTTTRDLAAELRRDLDVLERVVALTPAFDCTVDVDGRSRDLRVLALEVMNIGRIGPALPVAPSADPADGLLDIVWVEEAARSRLLSAVRGWQDRSMGGPFAEEGDTPFHRLRAPSVRVRCANALAHVDDRVWPSRSQRRARQHALDVSFGVEAGTLPLLV